MANSDAVRAHVRARARRAVEWLNPVVGSPSAALETAAWLDAFRPSLMPRTSQLQGAAAGLTVLAARGAGTAVDAILRQSLPAGTGLGRHLAVRAVAAAVGTGVGALPPRSGELLPRAGVRSAGQVLTSAAVGGALYDTGAWLRARYPTQRAVRPLVVTALAIAGVAMRAGRELVEREAAVERWPVEQRNTLPAAIAVATVTDVVGSALARSFVASRRTVNGYLGPGWSKRMLAGVTNAGLWSLAVSGLYNAGVAAIGRANEAMEPGYSRPPVSPLLSGGPASVSPFEDLGQQGRRYVTEVVTPQVIGEVLGERATAHPIRTYVGFNSEPIYASGRAELALAELERTGAFDRSYLLLVNPTGTGWVDQTMIEAAELFTRGDIATCCIQYGRYPSFLSLQKVALGRSQFRLLLWGVTQRLRERPPDRRPRVLVFGESLGAWASSDVVMFAGLEGFDHYGIDRALWVGLPGLAKWSRNGMARGANDLVPAGTVGVFDRHEQIAALTDEQRAALRAVILSHDNDPIAQLSPDLLIARPDWLGEQRGRGVPDAMTWIPGVTFIQVLIDAANAMVTVPGEFKSFGHDYRGDMARFVLDGFDLPAATEEQIANVDRYLRDLERERAERIASRSEEEAPAPPAARTAEPLLAGVPLRQRRARGPRWLRSAARRPPTGDVSGTG
jgi:uncharacterized membrane protein